MSEAKKTSKSKFITADEFRSRFSPEQRAAIEARTKVLRAEHLTLTDLRKANKLTQKKLAKKLGVGQEHISRLENRADMLTS